MEGWHQNYSAKTESAVAAHAVREPPQEPLAVFDDKFAFETHIRSLKTFRLSLRALGASQETLT
jgi:hypothetical protein